MLTIHTDNTIEIDGERTGLRLTQRNTGTVIYSTNHGGTNYREHPMPHARYSTAHDAPASKVAGRAQLEADLRALIATL